MRRLRELADPIAIRRSGGQIVPPRRLRARTGAPGVSEFVAGGAAAAHELIEGLGVAGVAAERLDRRSIWNEGELPGVGREYGLAFHGAGYVHERRQRMFEPVAVLERAITGWQNLAVCRKRASEAPPADQLVSKQP